MILLSANNAMTTLAAGISASTTTIILATGTGALFPSPSTNQYFTLTLNDQATGAVYEICYCTARTGDSLTVLRGQEGTATRAWLVGDYAYNALTAAGIVPSGFRNLAVYAIVGGVQQVSVNGAAFTTVGATTFAAPPNGVANYEGWGAGGGSGGGSAAGAIPGGGGGGGYFYGIVTNLTTATTITVGAPGTAGSSTGPTDGGTGGTTSFGAIASATGGGGGQAEGGAADGAPGVGGTVSGGDLNYSGQSGNTGFATGGVQFASNGGAAWGCGSNGLINGTTNIAGYAGNFPGQGATAPINVANGAAGGAGLLIVRW